MNKKIVNLKKLNEMTLIKPVGLCWGGFDLLHSGHIMHFKFAKKYCKTLIVAINSDKCFPHKGRNRPFLRENTRLNILSSISEINYTLIYRGKYPRASESKGFLHGKILSTPFIPLEIFEKIQPDLYFKGYEYCGKKSRYS